MSYKPAQPVKPQVIAIDEKFDYSYPYGLDLAPDSQLHGEILARLLALAQSSKETISAYYGRWQEMDRTLCAFVDLSDDEEETLDNDERKPTSFVIPVSYAILSTDLSYYTSVFLDRDPIFEFGPRGPEDTLGTILLEQVIQADVINHNVPLQLHTAYRDGDVYGIAAAEAVWYTHSGWRTTYTQDTEVNEDGIEMPIGKPRRSRKKETLYEGNRLRNIDPYLMLPDPSVPFHEHQQGQFFGYLAQTNYVTLLEEEYESPTENFNAKYSLKCSSNSALWGLDDERASQRMAEPKSSYEGTRVNAISTIANDMRPLIELNMYVKLIPSEWGLGKSKVPERWKFRVIGDALIVQAKKTALDHNLFPIAVNAPEFDGYSAIPNSHLSVIYPMQKTIDWAISAAMMAQNSSINGRFFIDPSIWNLNDMKKNRDGQGWIVRKRRRFWGKDVLGWTTPMIPDTTSGNFNTAMQLLDKAYEISGAVDSSRGVITTGGRERVSSAEARGVMGAAISRLAHPAKVTSYMFMNAVAMFFAAHTQQFMTEDKYVKTTGEYERQLREEYGITDRHTQASPKDLAVRYDVIPHDGTSPVGQGVEAWNTLLQTLLQSPAGQQAFSQEIAEIDILNIVKHVARISGARNVSEFIKRGGKVKVVPDQIAMSGAHSGQLAPMPGGEM